MQKHRKSVFPFLLLFLIMFSTLVAATGDVAYIYKKTFSVDNNIVDIFEELGLVVDLIDERNLPNDFSSYKFIFVGDENYRFGERFPVNDYPSIIANYYFGMDWGLVNNDISSLASNTPLNVKISNVKKQVYTQAFFRTGSSIAIPYYYLPNTGTQNWMAPDLEVIAKTFTGVVPELGAVIAYGEIGDRLRNGKTLNANMCFFGIIHSKFWTNNAKEMFKDCIGHVIMTCDSDNDCSDDTTSSPFCKNGDVFQDVTSFSCENPGNLLSQCVDDTDSELVEECDFGCLNGECLAPAECQDDIDNDGDNLIDENDPGCWTNLGDPNTYNPLDDDESDGTIECFVNSDCGIDGFIGNNICFGNDVHRNYKLFNCLNPGTGNAICTDSLEDRLIEECNDGCSNGECKEIRCFTNSDCDDSNSFTQDTCNLPGTFDSFCTNVPIECFTNSDCNDNIRLSIDTCNLPGSVNSFCTNVPFECLINSDCNDNDIQTFDVCNEPGTVNSFCENIPIECFNDGDCEDNNENTFDFCKNPGTIDSMCNNIEIECFNDLDCDDHDRFTLDECHLDGTFESFCTNVPLNCLLDADCGPTGFIENEFCSEDEVLKKYQTSVCIDGGTTESHCFVNVESRLIQDCGEDECSEFEFVCNNKDVYKQRSCTSNSCGVDNNVATCLSDSVNEEVFVKECNFDCLNGECITECEEDNDCNQGEVCRQDECVKIECFNNNDCGLDGFSGSPFCQDNDSYRNFNTYECINPGQVNSFCNVDKLPSLIDECSDICVSGRCEDIECFVNTDCDDSNSFTQDTCNRPGTVNSFCTNEPIICFTDSDCGINGFIDGQFCSNNDVFQNHREFDCVNPGTTSSSCSQTVEQLRVVECSDSCVSGSCVTITCFNDNDCSDLNSETNDFCNNPGKVESYCTHENIICVGDNDCGTDRFTGNQYCVGNNVNRDYLDFSCQNPNTESSFCSNNIISNELFQCEFACANGQCVRCNDNVDCNDNDDTTQDTCFFSGTIDSFCAFEHIECTQDIECGTDSFIEVPFCIGDDVYQNYRTFMCINENTPGSYCDVDKEARLIKECDFSCGNGVCNEGIHDVGLIDFTGAVNGIKLKNSDNNVLNENDVLTCNEEYQIIIKAENSGDFEEDVTFKGNIENLISFNHQATNNLAPGDITGEKTKTVLIDLNSGFYTIEVEGLIDIDDNLGNNIVSREIEVVCLECVEDSDCSDDFIGENYCTEDDVYHDLHDFSCVNGVCIEDILPELVEMCSELCINGVCIEDGCTNNNDCNIDEFCKFEDEICGVPGECVVKPIICPSIYDPVCGCNQETYGNLCEANRAGVSILHDGECNETQCEDGIDNDGDGKIDGLIELQNGNQNLLVLNSMEEIRALVNTFDSSLLPVPIPTGFDNAGALNNDQATAKAICENAGFDEVKSKVGGAWTSCFNNHLTFWDGSKFLWNFRNACDLGNNRLDKLTCSKSLSDCSDGIDNDNDGNIDFPDDDGCESLDDSSEIMHDDDCPLIETQCSDGIDNDGDGKIDGLVNGGTGTFKFNNENEIRSFINNLPQYSNIPSDFENGGYLRDDAITREKICELKGYQSDLSFTSRGFSSCNNNHIAWWDESIDDFRIVFPACENNHWLITLTCGEPVSECSDGIDNDNDGDIDFPDDDGCESLDDSSEIMHDDDCSVDGGNCIPGDTLVIAQGEPFQVRSFVNQKANENGFTTIPTTSHNNGAVLNNAATANQVCNLAGFNKVKQVNCNSQYGNGCGFDSCHDNTMGYYDNNLDDFVIQNACLNNQWISTLVCECV
jgi:hypothetical protein